MKNKYFDKIYIINLDYHKERRENVSAELQSVGWFNYEFIDAAWGGNLPDTKELISSGKIAKTFIDANGILTKNIFACAMSHQIALQAFLDDPEKPETCLIVEDDITFMPVGIKMMLAGGLDIAFQELDKQDWDIFMWGMPHTHMPTWGKAKGCQILYEFKKNAPEWAGHAYQVTRRGAQKLIENNTPIQFAADCNLETADVNIFCTAYTLISQRIGEYPRTVANELHTHFGNKVLHGDSKEYLPSTLSIVTPQKNTDEYYQSHDKKLKFFNNIKSVEIAGDVDVESIEWKDFKTAGGDTFIGWPHIHLQG